MSKQKPARKLLYSVILIGLLCSLITVFQFLKPPVGPERSSCRPVYMSPAYGRIHGLDEKHSKYASKYSLYLYREQGKDPIPDGDNSVNTLTGIPVLFIHGNAGSYRQARSIASECANIYSNELRDSNKQQFDFFTADFNNEFSAFSGKTLLDQSSYCNDAIRFILSLYTGQTNAPRSVIVIGHSMGGIVSRIMVSLDNYEPDSINTIITLSSPHAFPPIAFDGDVRRVYTATDVFWKSGFSLLKTKTDDVYKMAKERLRDVTLISLTGGNLDTTLPADYTTLFGLVPETHGFTTYTSGISGVWSPIDHLAIVWCDQLRKKIARTLFEITDPEKSSKTYPLEQRMGIFRREFLTGLEESSGSQLDLADKLHLRIGDSKINQMQVLKSNPKIQLTESVRFNLFNISNYDKPQFSMLTSLRMSKLDRLETVEHSSVLLCRRAQFSEEKNQNIMAYVAGSESFKDLECFDVYDEVDIVPRSFSSTENLQESSLGDAHRPFSMLILPSKRLSTYDVMLVVESARDVYDDDFLVAELLSQDASHHNIGTKLPSLFGNIGNSKLSADGPSCNFLTVDGAWSSLLVYDIKLTLPKTSSGLYSTFIRQSNALETKYHVNARQGIRTFASGMGPFVPIPSGKKSMDLLIWSDEGTAIDVYVSLNLVESLKLLVLRYRLSIVSFCLFVVSICLYFQMRHLQATGTFPSLLFGLQMLCSPKMLLGTLSVMSVLTPLLKIELVNSIIRFIDPVIHQDSNESFAPVSGEYISNQLFLGMEESDLWFIGPLFLLISIAAISIVYAILIFIAFILSFSFRSTIQLLKRTGLPHDFVTAGTEEKRDGYPYRRAIGTGLLLLSIPLYIPYQLAYVICVCTQAITSIKLCCSQKLINFQSTNSSEKAAKLQSIVNFNISLLMLMLWTLPISIPTVIVWAHSIEWRNHNNFLPILPILFVVEMNARGTALPKAKLSSFQKFLNSAFILYIAFYALIYGVRHTFWLHHLVNIYFAWILYLFYIGSSDQVGSGKESTIKDESKLS